MARNRRILISLIAALICAAIGSSAPAQVAQVQDNLSWQNQFLGAQLWSTLGVVADGATDNTAALNALPLNTPIIGDCLGGSTINVAGSWYWRAGLTVWQQPGCEIVSGVTTVGNYAIDDPNFGNNLPNDNIQYYGLYLTMATPVSTVRVMRLWSDHFKLKYFNIPASGGLFFLRGSDQEIAYGIGYSLSGQGNPGIRHIGNVPKVPASPGMPANVWMHNLYFSVGDGAFQVCQPLGTSSWLNVSTDDILYQDSYGISTSSGVMLVNAGLATAQSNYTCNNVKFVNVSGQGLYTAIIAAGNAPSSTNNISIIGGTTDETISTSVVSSIPIGDINIGGLASASTASNIIINGVTILNSNRQQIQAVGSVSGLQIENSTFGVARNLAFPMIDIQGTTGTVINNNSITTGPGSSGISLGDTTLVTSSPIVTNNNISGVGQSRQGILLGNVNAASVTGNAITKYSGTTTSIGIGLTTAANPNPGTTNSTVTLDNVSAMPVPIVCASGQGNSVTNNTGASDCTP